MAPLHLQKSSPTEKVFLKIYRETPQEFGFGDSVATATVQQPFAGGSWGGKRSENHTHTHAEENVGEKNSHCISLKDKT